MIVPKSANIAGSTIVLLAAISAAAMWLWVCWCVFPGSVWNDVRLAPAFAIARGWPLYPSETNGAVGTWIYGPLPPLLWWPATWASNAGHALEIAGLINILTTVGAIAAVCAWWPAPAKMSLPWRERLVAAVVAIAIWPFAAFQYLQADNVAVALGLIGNLLLVRARGSVWFWGAAACAVASLACKQTSLGVAAAQIIWLALTAGPAVACRHGGRCLAIGCVLVVTIGIAFGWNGTNFNVFLLPSHLPWTSEIFRRLTDLAPELSIQIVVPALVMVTCRRTIWNRSSALLLPSLSWLCAMLPGLVSLMKIGGTINSLQSFGYWLPPSLIVALAAVWPHQWTRRVLSGGAVAVVAICGVRLARMPAQPWWPLIEHYRQADFLARKFPGETWFPWNPLVTIYSEDRLYHVEDGLYVRFLTGHALTLPHARAHLPQRMGVIALPRGGTDWGIALSLIPPSARRHEFGLWTLYSWAPQDITNPPMVPPHG